MSRSVWPIRAGLAVLSAGVVAAICAVTFPAGAAEGDIGIVSVAAVTHVQYKAAYGRSNSVLVSRSGNTITVDDVLAIKAGTGCKAVSGDRTKVRCTLKKTPVRTDVYLYDRDDRVVNKAGLGMSADGGDGVDTLGGGPGNDILDGGNGNDKVYGLGGNDRLEGGMRDDLLSGGDGNDTLLGDWGNDTMYGGPGRDTFYGQDGNDLLSGADGVDLLSGGAGKDVLHGGTGDDRLLGDAGDDTVNGDAGNDSLDGHQGRDRLTGGAGNDWLFGDDPRLGAPVADVLLGGAGQDRVHYNLYTGAVRVDLDGASGDDGSAGERDTVGADVEGIVAGDGNDVLTGNGAANFIDARGGVDAVRGGAGNDTLAGGDGRDSLYGESGDDMLDGVDDYVDRLDAGTNGAAGDQCMARLDDTLIGCERPIY